MFAVIGTVGLVIVAVVGTAVGAVLFYHNRKNKNTIAKVNAAVDRADTLVSRRG